MRLTALQAQAIHNQVRRYLGESAMVWLFGSRIDDSQRGGDVDLYVETGPHALMDELRCKVMLQDLLEAPVDLVVRSPMDRSPIADIAKRQGMRL